MPKYGQKRVKNKNIFYEVLIVFYLILLDFLRQTIKKFRACWRVQDCGEWEEGDRMADGENELASKHKFNLLQMLLMKFCYVRNKYF